MPETNVGNVSTEEPAYPNNVVVGVGSDVPKSSPVTVMRPSPLGAELVGEMCVTAKHGGWLSMGLEPAGL